MAYCLSMAASQQVIEFDDQLLYDGDNMLDDTICKQIALLCRRSGIWRRKCRT